MLFSLWWQVFELTAYSTEEHNSLDIGTFIANNFLSHLETPGAQLCGPHLLPAIAFPFARCLSCHWLVPDNLQQRGRSWHQHTGQHPSSWSLNLNAICFFVHVILKEKTKQITLCTVFTLHLLLITQEMPSYQKIPFATFSIHAHLFNWHLLWWLLCTTYILLYTHWVPHLSRHM